MKGRGPMPGEEGATGEPLTVAAISLGCPKNLVDTEVMLARLALAGFIVTPDARAADVVLVNTCAFIDSAREESLLALRRAAGRRRGGKRPAVVAAGCLVERLGEKIMADVPALAGALGTGAPGAVVAVTRAALAGKRPVTLRPAGYMPRRPPPRLQSTPRHYAYLKIAEGCANRCCYCLIPSLRGDLKSRPAGEVVGEAKSLIAGGARELVLVAQDTTRYGFDLHGGPRLAGLVRRLASLSGLEWLRVMYANPARVDDELLAAMAGSPAVCRYLDLPVQHASPRVLRAMGRPGGGEEFLRLVERVRGALPGVALRTTLMVGYPGETEADVRELEGFVTEARFDHAGVFTFSPQEGTPAAALPSPVPATAGVERAARVLAAQRKAAAAAARRRIGATLRAVVEGAAGGRWVRGRASTQAPEVDGTLRLFGDAPPPGEFVDAVVVGAGPYHLCATVKR